MIEHAIVLACWLHEGQVDKAGQPYIFHPLRVMEKIRARGGDEILQAAAVLHDGIEDSSITPTEMADHLIAAGAMPPDAVAVVEIVVRVSRQEGEDYHAEFIPRCCGDPRALEVKDCDLEDNIERLADLEQTKPETALALRKKYLTGQVIVASARNEFVLNGRGDELLAR